MTAATGPPGLLLPMVLGNKKGPPKFDRVQALEALLIWNPIVGDSVTGSFPF
jgi:hypothetical protein